MRLNSSWILIALVFWIAADGVVALRGSELVLQARKQAEEPKPVANNESGDNSTVAEGGSKADSNAPKLTGNPQIDYIHDPNLPRELNGHNLSTYPFYNAIPTGIEFECDGLHDGFYASVPHHCQVYHHCLFGIRYDFLCANYTAFDQKTFICHFVSEVDCNNSPKYYNRNEALYKTTTSAPIVIPTTKATTTAAPERRQRPKKRRPAYEYYYDDEYEDDEEYYDDYQPPPRKRNHKPKANKWREPEVEDEDESKVRPQGAPGTVFDAPRAPPKVRRPVPLNERHKYEYSTISTSPSKVSKLSNTKGSNAGSDETTQKPDGERRQSEKKRNKKRPNRYESDYYEDEFEEEEEVRPPKKNNRNRNDDNWRQRNRNKGHRGDGYRDRPERGGNRGRYQDGPSKRRYENRPTYDDEEEYDDEYEEDSGYRGRYDDNRRKKGEGKRRKDEGQSGGRYDDNKRWKGSRDDRRSGGGRYDSDRRRPYKDERRGESDKGKRRPYEDSYQDRDNLYDNDDYDNEPKDSSQVDVESRKKASNNKNTSRRNQPEPTKPSTTTTTTKATTKQTEKPKTTTAAPLTLEDDYYDEYEYDDVIESPDQNKGKGIETTTLGSTTTAKKQEYKYNRFTRKEEVRPSTTSSYRVTTPSPSKTTENSATTSSEQETSKRFRPRADLKLKESLTEKILESAFESSFRNQRNNSAPLQPQRFQPTSSLNPFASRTEVTTRNYPSFNVRDRTPSRDSFRMRNGVPNLQVTSQPTSLYKETRRPISVTETSERDYSLLSNEFSRGQIQYGKSKFSNDGDVSSLYQTTSLTPNRGLRVEYTLDLSQTTPSLPSTKYIADKPTTRRPDKKIFKSRLPQQTEVPQIDKKPAVIQPRNPSPPPLSTSSEFTYKNQGNQGYVIYNQRVKPVTERQALLFPKKPPTSFGSTAPGPSAPSGPSANGKILPVRSGYPNYGNREYELEVNEEDYDVAINDGIQPSTLHPTRTAGPNLHIKVNTRGYDVGQPQSTLRAPQTNYYQPQHYFSNIRAETVPPNQREYETYIVSAPRYSLNPSRLPQQPSSRSKEWTWK